MLLRLVTGRRYRQVLLQRRVRAEPPAGPGVIVPCREGIQPGLGVQFLTGKAMAHAVDAAGKVLFHPHLTVGGIGEVLVALAFGVGHPVGAAEVVGMVIKRVLGHVQCPGSRTLVAVVQLTRDPGLAHEDMLGYRRRRGGTHVFLVHPVGVQGFPVHP